MFGPSDGWDLLTPEQQAEVAEWEDAQDATPQDAPRPQDAPVCSHVNLTAIISPLRRDPISWACPDCGGSWIDMKNAPRPT